MRQIGTLQNEAEALRFAAFLVTLGITAHAEHEPDGWVVWVRDEDHLDQAIEEFKQYRQDPGQQRYQGAEKAANSIRREEEKRREQMSKNVVEMRGRWGKAGAQRKPLTVAMIIISVIVFMLTGFGNDQKKATSFPMRTLLFADMMQPRDWDHDNINDRLGDISRGQVWRLVTPIFVHMDTLHIIFNMLMLWWIGGQVENYLRTPRFALLILVLALTSSTIGSLVPTAYGGSAFGGGMSGVVYGLFGFMWMKSLYDPGSGLRVSGMLAIMMIGWLFIGIFGLYKSFMPGVNIDNWAHGIGLIVGIGIGYWPEFFRGMKKG